MSKRTQYIKASEIPKELKTEGRCYCHCWKCSALIVTFDCTPVNSPLATPTTSIAERVDRSSYNPNDSNNTLNNTSLSSFSKTPDSIKSPNEPLVIEKIINEPKSDNKKEIQTEKKEQEPQKEPEISIKSNVETKPLPETQNIISKSENITVAEPPLDGVLQIELVPELKPEIESVSKVNLEPVNDTVLAEEVSSMPEVKPTEIITPEVTPSTEEAKSNSNENPVNGFQMDNYFEPIEITKVEKVFKPITSRSTATIVDQGTIELTTVTESEGTVLHTAVTKINIPEFEDYHDIFDAYKNTYRPLRVIEEEPPNSAQSNYHETVIITTTIINPDGSVTKTTRTTTTIKKSTVITILTSDGRVLIKSRALQ